MIKIGVILAAGKGTRLMPLTKDIPKCLVKINNKSLIEYSIEALKSIGIKKVVIVIGYMGHKIKEKLGYNYVGVNISYINNFIYEKSNNMYSLYLAINNINEEIWILESDIIFDKNILNKNCINDIGWFVDSKIKNIDGSYIKTNKKDIVINHEIVSNERDIKEDYKKSLGIIRCSKEGLNFLKEWLKNSIERFEENLYYDLILAQHLKTEKISAIDVNGSIWFEIDNKEDLEIARKFFK